MMNALVIGTVFFSLYFWANSVTEVYVFSDLIASQGQQQERRQVDGRFDALL